MVVRLGTNISSLMAQRRLGNASASAEKIYEQLSSGMRINRASDDAAGLAISKDLNAARKVYTQGILNGNDGQSLLSIAESTIGSLTDIVIRIRELSEQAANGTLGNKQRAALDSEAQSLSKEYFRISRSSSFNKINLFDGTLSEGVRLQLGFGLEGSLQSRLGGALGTGTFGGATTYATESLASNETVLADLNGDGILDLVTAGASGAVGYATVRLGAGDGSFGAATSYLAESLGTEGMTVGDINNDGILDLVTAGYDSSFGYTTVRLGVGDGTFGASTSYLANGPVARDVTLVDLNDDGTLDMISVGGTSGGSVNIRFGNGNGTFGSATSYASESAYSTAVQIADLNGDGILDLVTAGSSGGGIGGKATVRLGTGNGQFGAATSYDTEGFGGAGASNDLALGDLNGDGILDLVTAGLSTRTGVSTVRLGSADGTFGTATSYAFGGATTTAVHLADMNGDGMLDMVVASPLGTGRAITVDYGTGSGTFQGRVTLEVGLVNVAGLDVGDIDGDGVLDIVGAGASGGIGAVAVFKANTRDGISPIEPFSLKTKADALQAMGMLDRTIQNLTKQRGTIGAYQSRLSVALNVLRNSADSYAAAESRITDVDFSEKAADLARVKILQQASVAILAQTNLEPQLALKLLR